MRGGGVRRRSQEEESGGVRRSQEEEEGRRGGGDEEERQRWCPELQFFLYLVILWRGSIHTPLSPPHLNSRRLHFFSIIHKLFVFCCGAVQSRSQPF